MPKDDLWFSDLDKKGHGKKPKTYLKYLLLLLALPIIYLSFNGKALFYHYEDDIYNLLPFLKEYIAPKKKNPPLKNTANIKTTENNNSKDSIPLLPNKSTFYIITDQGNNKFFTSNLNLVPEQGYKALDFARVNNKKKYCWSVNNTMFCTKGIPVSSKKRLYRIISIQ
ncbi:MAG: hypothetical protein OCC45_13360 [Desulfotalea sp.]